MVLGLGASSCGKFISDTSGDVIDRNGYMSWLTGYITSFNEFTPTDGNITRDTDVDGVLYWIENYCKENPTVSFGNAASAALLFLEKTSIEEIHRDALKALGESRDEKFRSSLEQSDKKANQSNFLPDRPPAFLRGARPAPE